MSECILCSENATGRMGDILFCGTECQRKYMIGVKYRRSSGLSSEERKQSITMKMIPEEDIMGAKFKLVEKQTSGKVQVFVDKQKKIVYFVWPKLSVGFDVVQRKMVSVYNDINQGILVFKAKKKKTRREEKKKKMEPKHPQFENLIDILDAVEMREIRKINEFITENYKKKIESMNRFYAQTRYLGDLREHVAHLFSVTYWQEIPFVKSLTKEGIVYFTKTLLDMFHEEILPLIYVHMARVFWSSIFRVVGYETLEDSKDTFDARIHIIRTMEDMPALRLWFVFDVDPSVQSIAEAILLMRHYYRDIWEKIEMPRELGYSDEVERVYFEYFTQKACVFYSDVNEDECWFPNFLERFVDGVQSDTLPDSGFYFLSSNRDEVTTTEQPPEI